MFDVTTCSKISQTTRKDERSRIFGLQVGSYIAMACHPIKVFS